MVYRDLTGSGNLCWTAAGMPFSRMSSGNSVQIALFFSKDAKTSIVDGCYTSDTMGFTMESIFSFFIFHQDYIPVNVDSLPNAIGGLEMRTGPFPVVHHVLPPQ